MGKFIGILACLFAAHCQAASVWQVTNGEHTLYLGGTLHLLSPSDYPLPDAYNQAYALADTLVFETDMATVSSPAFAGRMMQQNTYQNGQTIKNALTADTYQLLTEFLAQRKLPLAHLEQMKPALLGLTLTMLEYQKNGLTSEGVDAHFFAKAQADNKAIDWFETPQQQLDFISRMADNQEDAFIRYTLEDIQELSSHIDPLVRFWRQGDMNSLFTQVLKDFEQQYPQVYADLLVNRNANWLPHLEKMLNSAPTEFVLVGTLHMPGKHGVLALLEKAGYRVTRLDASSVTVKTQ